MPDRIRIVYRPKTEEERLRRVKRATEIQAPFVRLPGNAPGHQVMFTASTGHKVRVADVEMVFNDALLMDAISNWGEDGPLTKDTYTEPEDQIMREIYDFAQKVFAGVELPPSLRPPEREGKK